MLKLGALSRVQDLAQAPLREPEPTERSGVEEAQAKLQRAFDGSGVSR